jgi:hypothetical protein
MSFNRINFSLFVILLIAGPLSAQQNQSLFLMHQVPESNLLNPAIPVSCKYYIGLPVISSIHLNYGNSLLSYNQLFQKSTDGPRTIEIDKAISNMHNRDFVGTEAHVQLLAFGYRYNEYSFMFTITEKNNIPFTIPKNGAELLWNGNTQFEGSKAGMKGAGVYFHHYREYAISASKKNWRGTYWGVRAKLLFGKLNLSSPKVNLSVYTDDRTFDLRFNGDFRLNSSLPIIVYTNDYKIDSIVLDESISTNELIFNRKNPGFSTDFGVIYPYNKKLTLSASILDLGFIWWRSNLNNVDAGGDFVYKGSLGQPSGSGNYFNELKRIFLDSMKVTQSQKKYVSMLPVHLIAGANYEINKMFSAGLVADALIFRSRINPSLTLMGQYFPFKSLSVTASYTLNYHSYTNFGLGLVVGKDPVQFYVVSTNIPGLFKPLDTRSINLRFGMNIIIGCNLKENRVTGTHPSMPCPGVDRPEKPYKKKLKKHKKNK